MRRQFLTSAPKERTDLPVFAWWLVIVCTTLISFHSWYGTYQYSTAVWFHSCAISPSTYTLSYTVCSRYKRHAMTFKSSTPAWSYTILGFSLACKKRRWELMSPAGWSVSMDTCRDGGINRIQKRKAGNVMEEHIV